MIVFPRTKNNLKFTEWVGEESFPFERNSQSMVHAVQFNIPCVTEVPQPIDELLSPENNAYLYVEQVKLPSLFDNVFIEAFVKRGFLSGCTVKGSTKEFIQINHSGKLVVAHRSCRHLGLPNDVLPGKKKKKKKNYSNRITLDLLSPSFSPGEKWHTKVTSEFEKMSDVSFDFIITWVPHDSDICPSSSLKEYFESKGHNCRVCEPKQSSFVKLSVPTPKFNFEDLSSNQDFLEWIGCQVCGIDCMEENSVVDGYTLTDHEVVAGRLLNVAYQGFYPTAFIQKLHSKARLVLSSNSSVPFVSVVIHGFQQREVLTFVIFQNSFKCYAWYYSHNHL